MQRTITRLVVILSVVTVAVFLCGIGLLVEAQDPANQNSNKDPATPQTKSPRRKTSKSNSNTGTPETQQQPASTEAMPATQTEQTTTPTTKSKRTRTRATTAAASTQADLSGTYAGTFNCDEVGLTGDTTLTITGNQFTTADGRTGHIVANTTAGYTAVALQLDTPAATGAQTTTTPATTTPAPVVSLRAKRSGNRLTLSPVSGSASRCSFTPGHAMASRRKGTRTNATVPPATGAEVASPAAVGPSPADVTAPAKSRRSKSRKTTTQSTPATMPVPATPPPSAVPSESPAQPLPSQSPIPNPSPSPTPVPSPSGSPTPSVSPSPEASPSPSPTPSPSPRPRNG